MSNLYDAGVMFMVSERTEGDAWNTIATYVANSVNIGVKELKERFKVVEEQLKKDYNVTTLPSKWRSAKSVALKAVATNTPLVIVKEDGSKEAIGKTVVENDIKARIGAKNALLKGSKEWYRNEIIDVHTRMIDAEDLLNDLLKTSFSKELAANVLTAKQSIDRLVALTEAFK